jgi:hypothetical protein
MICKLGRPICISLAVLSHYVYMEETILLEKARSPSWLLKFDPFLGPIRSGFLFIRESKNRTENSGASVIEENKIKIIDTVAFVNEISALSVNMFKYKMPHLG